MACCGQRRAAVAVPLCPAAATTPEPGRASAVNLRYLSSRSVPVRGPVTGQLYSFSGVDQLQPVEHRDVVGILHSGLIRAI